MIRAVLSATGCLLLAAAFAAAGPESPPRLDARQRDIELPGAADFIALEDINGDGRGDLLVMQHDRIHLYYQTADRDFPPQPSETVFPGKLALLVDFADMNGNGSTDIVITTTRGAYYLEYEKSKIGATFHVLHKLPPAFPAATSGKFPWLDFVTDCNGDGVLDMWVPQTEGLVFLLGGKDGFRPTPPFDFLNNSAWRLERFPAELQMAVHYAFYYGRFRVLDCTGDHKLDLAYVTRENVVIHPQQADGGFLPGERFSIRLPVEPPSRMVGHRPISFEDVTGDGWPDLVLLIGDEGVVKIYEGGAELREFDAPAQVIREKGLIYNCTLKDVDGDGRPDLVTEQTTPINWAKALRIFIAQETSTYLQIYRNRAGEGTGLPFSKRNDYIESFDNPLVFTIRYGQAEVDTKMFLNAYYDFNNDGRKDVLALTDARQISLYLGSPAKGMYPEKPSIGYTIPDTDPYIRIRCSVADLDRDGYNDFVLHYQNQPGANDRLLVGILEVGQ